VLKWFVGLMIVALTASVAYADPTDPDKRLAASWQQLEAVIERYNTAREDLRVTGLQLGQVQAQLGPLETSVAAAEARAAEMSSAMYRSGPIGGFTALLEAKSPDVLIDQLTVLDHLDRERSRRLLELRESRDKLVEQRRQLVLLSQRKTDEQAALATQKTTIEAQIRQLQGTTTGTRRAVREPSGALHDGWTPLFSPDSAGAAVRFAYNQLGKAYKFATEGPDTYDCSGLVMASWKSAGVNLPHNAAAQYRTVQPITRGDLKPGDLVFYYRDIHHVALYVGNERVIEAPQPGERISMRAIDFGPIAGYGRVKH
jgi:cell wall-associated NlpC family hydrolase